MGVAVRAEVEARRSYRLSVVAYATILAALDAAGASSLAASVVCAARVSVVAVAGRGAEMAAVGGEIPPFGQA